jgi:hypothetical protein
MRVFLSTYYEQTTSFLLVSNWKRNPLRQEGRQKEKATKPLPIIIIIVIDFLLSFPCRHEYIFFPPFSTFIWPRMRKIFSLLHILAEKNINWHFTSSSFESQRGVLCVRSRRGEKLICSKHVM